MEIKRKLSMNFFIQLLLAFFFRLRNFQYFILKKALKNLRCILFLNTLSCKGIQENFISNASPVFFRMVKITSSTFRLFSKSWEITLPCLIETVKPSSISVGWSHFYFFVSMVYLWLLKIYQLKVDTDCRGCRSVQKPWKSY